MHTDFYPNHTAVVAVGIRKWSCHDENHNREYRPPTKVCHTVIAVRCVCPTDTNRRGLMHTFYSNCIASVHVMVVSINHKRPPHCRDLVDNHSNHRIQSRGETSKNTAENINLPFAINPNSLSTNCVSHYF